MVRKTRKRKTNNIRNYYNFSEDVLKKLFAKKRYKAVVEWENEKEEVRKTKEWLLLKCFVAHRQNGLDPFTLSKLPKSANLHHMSYKDEEYGDLNSDKFILLGQLSHKCTHFILACMHKNGKEYILQLLSDLYDRTYKLNKDIKTWKQAH